MEEKYSTQIEILNGRIAKLEAAALQKTEIQSTVTPVAFLYQNQPNPFNNTTTIQYVLPHKKAVLVIRDLNGKALQQINLTGGKGSVTINAAELVAGTYTYSLVVNNVCADTKLMVIAK